MTSGCRPECVGRWIRWLVVGLGIAKSRPGKSGRGQGGGVLPANFCDVSGELIALHLGGSACSNVACFVVAVAKHSPRIHQQAHMKTTESFHLGWSREHFPVKSCLQISSSFMRNSVMGAEFLMMRSPLLSFRFLFFFPPHCLSLSPGGVTVVVVVGFLGGGLMKLGGMVTLREWFMTISKTLSKPTRQSLTNKRSFNFLHSPKPTLNLDFRGIQSLGGEVAIGGNAPLENYLLGQNCGGKQFYSNNKGAACAK